MAAVGSEEAMSLKDLKIEQSAVFSPSRKYRYVLRREWGDTERKMAVFIGLNPSTADETTDDPTIRRCMGYARDWGCSGLYMLNLFAVRATDPKDMLADLNPVGADNESCPLPSSNTGEP